MCDFILLLLFLESITAWPYTNLLFVGGVQCAARGISGLGSLCGTSGVLQALAAVVLACCNPPRARLDHLVSHPRGSVPHPTQRHSRTPSHPFDPTYQKQTNNLFLKVNVIK